MYLKKFTTCNVRSQLQRSDVICE